jgi:very-short-patch-repair endonuclease
MPRRALIPVELASRPFHIEEARRHGLSKYHLDGPTWIRLGGGYYAVREIADAPLVRLVAASRRLPSGAVFSGRTAAWLYGLDVEPCNPIEVTVPIGSSVRRLAGISVARCLEIEKSIVKRLAVTPRVRTVADLGRRLPLVEAVMVVDAALHQRLVKLTDLNAWLKSHNRYPGTARLRCAMGLAESATESVMETRLRLLLVLDGLPRPQAQISLHDVSGHFLGRPDLYYPRQRLALEYDGATHRDSLAADNRRQNRLVNAGYRLLRFTAADVLSAPDSVVGLVRQALQSPA